MLCCFLMEPQKGEKTVMLDVIPRRNILCFPLYAMASISTDRPPDDWPKTVTRSLSPPNPRIFSDVSCQLK
jgi:hypothetical protein